MAMRVRRFLGTHWMLVARLAVIPPVLGSLWFPPSDLGETGLDWAVSLTAAAVSLAGTRWPLTVLLIQTALAAVTTTGITPLGTGTVQVFVGLAAIEAIVYRRGAGLVAALAAAELVTIVNIARNVGPELVPIIFRVALSTGVILLVGALARSVRATIREAEERAREVERRREADTRAARAEERTAIARELHDLVAHHLSSIVLRTGVARHVSRDRGGSGPRSGTRLDPELDPVLDTVLDPALSTVLNTVLDDVHRNAGAALTDLRQLVSVLRDPERVDEGPGAMITDTDPRAALDAIVERVTRAGLRVSARIDPDLGDLDTVRRLAVVRLAQEALTNALRHATGATQAVLIIERCAGGIRVEVNDDGTAVPVGDPYGSGGHGLAGMRERVDLVGGRFTAGATGRGWRVVAEMPVGDPVTDEAVTAR
jgi:signal transduction histidine kinase